MPASHGVFELELDDEVLFSKRRQGRFPTYAEIQPVLEERLGPPPHWR